MCREYFTVSSFYRPGFCSLKCLQEKQAEHPPVRKLIKPKRKGPRIPRELRDIVNERDKKVCRWCGSRRFPSQHHVRYLSELPDKEANVESNLLTLCNDKCHPRAHSNKRLYQPLLLTVLYLEYFHGQHLTVPQVQEWLASLESEALD